MNSSWELKEKSMGELNVAIEGDVWQNAQKKAFQTISKNISLPGFRKGKVPASIVKKHVNDMSVLAEAVDYVVQDALLAAIKEHDLQVVGKPSMDIKSLSKEKADLIFYISVYPTFTLGEYKNLNVTKEKVEVTDSDINDKLEKELRNSSELVLKEEGNVEQGDTVVIDFEGFKEGVAFEGGKGENYPLEIGSNTFIPGFEEQLVGMKSNETKEIHVTFPQEYQVADLAGQDVVFKVTVNKIEFRKLPELTDAYVSDLKIENVTNVEEYKEFLKTTILKEKEKVAEQNFENQLVEKVLENTNIEIPNVMIEHELDNMMKDFEQRLSKQGFNMEMYLQITNATVEQIREQMSEDATKKVKLSLILDAVIKQENIKVSDTDVENEIEAIAKTYNMDVTQVKSLITNDSISYDLSMRKAMQLIKETAGK